MKATRVVLVAGVAVAARLAYAWWRAPRREGQTPEILENDPEGLPTDYLVNGGADLGGQRPAPQVVPSTDNAQGGDCAQNSRGVVDAPGMAHVAGPNDSATQGCPAPQGETESSPACPTEGGEARKGMTSELVSGASSVNGVTHPVGTIVEVREHRSIAAGCENLYYAHVVREVRARFGRMERSDANMKVVRRFVNNLCTEHGLRAVDRARVTAFAVATIDLPTESEIEVERDVLRYRRYRHGLWKRVSSWFGWA